MKTLILSACLLTAAPAVFAYTDTGGRFTSGPDGYAGVSAFAEWGNDYYYLRPSMNTYKSDLSDRKSTYSLGAGLERGRWSAGAELSLTPETDGYKNSSLFADLTYILFEAQEEGAALSDASVGVFAGVTAHEDAYSLSSTTVSSGGRGRGDTGSVTTLEDAFRLNQTDYGVSASVRLFGLRAGGRYTKTAYDKDIASDARQLPIDIGGIGASGFPDTAVSARLSAPGLPLSPSVGYTLTTYLLDQPDSESVSAGLRLKAGPAELSGGWERFIPGDGLESSDYWSVGLTLSF